MAISIAGRTTHAPPQNAITRYVPRFNVNTFNHTCPLIGIEWYFAYGVMTMYLRVLLRYPLVNPDFPIALYCGRTRR